MSTLQNDTLNDEFSIPAAEFSVTDEAKSPPLLSRELRSLAENPTNPWDPRLILDLAIGVDGIEDILTRYDLTEAEFEALASTPLFRRELSLAIRDARENGAPFANKARVQAESYLPVIDTMVVDPTTPASVRLEAIRSIVKWGKLEVDKAAEKASDKVQVNVQINF